MKKNVRFVSALMVSVMAVSMLAGCSTQPAQGDEIYDDSEALIDNDEETEALPEGITEAGENGGPVLRVEETLVDGIVHHAYYEYELDDRTNAWLDSVLSAIESGDNENVAFLCGFQGQNQEELAWVADKLTSGEIGEEAGDRYGKRRSWYRLWKDGYKVGISLLYDDLGSGIWNAKVFFIPEDGSVGYAVDSSVYTYTINGQSSFRYSCDIWTGECESGMFNGEASAFIIHTDSDNSLIECSDNYLFECTCMVNNGLYDGEYSYHFINYRQSGKYEAKTLAVYDKGIIVSKQYWDTLTNKWEEKSCENGANQVITFISQCQIDGVMEQVGSRDVYPY